MQHKTKQREARSDDQSSEQPVEAPTVGICRVASRRVVDITLRKGVDVCAVVPVVIHVVCQTYLPWS